MPWVLQWHDMLKIMIPLDAYVVWCPTRPKNLVWYLIEIVKSNSYLWFIYFAGSWFAAAYLEPTNEPQGFLRQQCRYSLGSIALWNRAENVALIQPNQLETFQTTRHFSYYKFYIPEEINQFTVTLSNCKVCMCLFFSTRLPLTWNSS